VNARERGRSGKKVKRGEKLTITGQEKLTRKRVTSRFRRVHCSSKEKKLLGTVKGDCRNALVGLNEGPSRVQLGLLAVKKSRVWAAHMWVEARDKRKKEAAASFTNSGLSKREYL